MGCTSSKEKTNPPTIKLTDNEQQLIDDQFRHWLNLNRPKADDYVFQELHLNDVSTHDIEDYRSIISQTLDLLVEHSDIKSESKLNKLVNKQVQVGSPKKIAKTIDVLKQTIEKLRHGQIQFDECTNADKVQHQV
jgi:hypothetical protein